MLERGEREDWRGDEKRRDETRRDEMRGEEISVRRGGEDQSIKATVMKL